MSKNTSVYAGTCSFVLCLTSFAALRGQAQEVPVQRGARVIYETHHDLSPPLRDLVALYGQQQPQPGAQRVAPLGRFGNPYSVPPGERDPALQEESEGPLVSTTNLLNFDGLTADESGGVAPPDTNGAVGTTQFVQTVNTAYEVFDKTTGHSLLGPTQINIIFSGFGGACESGPNFSDPSFCLTKWRGAGSSRSSDRLTHSRRVWSAWLFPPHPTPPVPTIAIHSPLAAASATTPSWVPGRTRTT